MSDKKNYYYLKLKDNYFDQDNIKILESMKNGHIYSLIILKLYIKSCKYEGQLMMTHEIPYNPSDVEILANVIHHDIAHVKEAIRNGIKLGLITILNQKEFWMTEIQNFIGHSSTEADRIREYRSQLKIDRTNVQQMYNKSTPELEKDIDKEKDIDSDEINKKSIENNIYTFWNNLSIINHTKLTDKTKRIIKTTLQDYTEKEITDAIKNYSVILKKDKYYFSYRWTLKDFLKRGLEKFMDNSDPFNNFLKKDFNSSKKKEIDISKLKIDKNEVDYSAV